MENRYIGVRFAELKDQRSEAWRGGAVRFGVSAGASPASHFQQVAQLAFRRGMASPPRSCSRLDAIAPRILVLAAHLDDEG